MKKGLYKIIQLLYIIRFNLLIYFNYILSATLNLALLDLGFSSISSLLGSIGFLVITFTSDSLSHWHIGKCDGHTQSSAKSLNSFFTILSSNEWKVIIQTLPPSFIIETASSIILVITPSSLLTSILIAWKVLFAGCGPSILAFLGIAFFITSTSSPVVSIG